MTAILRAIRRAGLPMAYSQGYHPKPRVSFGPALPVGVESRCEYLDLELVGEHDAADIGARLGAKLPEGFEVFEARTIDARAESISASLRAVHYVAEFPAAWADDALRERIEAFAGSPRSVVRRIAPPKGGARGRGEKIAPGKAREIDLKEVVTHLALDGSSRVAFSLKADPSGSAKPAEVLAAVFGEGAPPRGVKVLKEGVSFARGAASPAGQPRAPRYLDA
jgi:radical SAM-linked protein